MKPGRHICTECNFIYEETKEHPNISTTRPFDELADDWKCPKCGAPKDKFQPCSCVTVESGVPHKHEHGHEAHAPVR